MDPLSIGAAMGGSALLNYFGQQQQTSAINQATNVQQNYYNQLMHMQQQLMQQSAPFRAYLQRLMPTLYASAMNPQQSQAGRAASQSLGQSLAARGLTGSPAAQVAQAGLASQLAEQGIGAQHSLASMMGNLGQAGQQQALSLFAPMDGAVQGIGQNIMAAGGTQAGFMSGLGSMIGQLPMQMAYMNYLNKSPGYGGGGGGWGGDTTNQSTITGSWKP